MGAALVFSQFQVLLSHVWSFKKNAEGGRDIKGEKRSRTRKQEREEEGVKTKKK